eukprot:NODE_374_length_1824_cov_97.051831_g315_i0.p1 GENE.NODE_374_length_1824_cov_97.051831_g315_i0~~NODE_374_length_1824_cov_97.051831_g315_i0.p1  ORF type:complete len:203 (+),score=63.18 NODE_374_length_1824_cov_97.051831_g315_i0:1062-1670(+)
MECFHELHQTQSAISELFQPVISTLENIQTTGRLPSELKQRHNALLNLLISTSNISKKLRRPLMMQTHRPIPLKLMDPLIQLSAAEKRVQKEAKTRHEMRKLQKLNMRQAQKTIRADSRYLQVAQEKETELEDMRRQKKYDAVLQQLREQKSIVGKIEMPWQKKRVEMASKLMKESDRAHNAGKTPKQLLSKQGKRKLKSKK